MSRSVPALLIAGIAMAGCASLDARTVTADHMERAASIEIRNCIDGDLTSSATRERRRHQSHNSRLDTLAREAQLPACMAERGHPVAR